MAKNADKRGGKKPLPLKNKILFGILFAAIAALFIVGVLLIIQENSIPTDDTPPPNITPPPTFTPTPAPSGPPGQETLEPTSTPQPTPYIPPLPVKIYFPRLKVSTEIIPAGINADGEMAAAEDAHIATWYMYGASPGEQGNAIIAGHVTWKGKKGNFAVLPQLKEDDEVVIEFREGYTRKFRVVSNDAFDLDSIPDWVMKLDSGDARVTLITCAGEFDRQLGTRNKRNVVVLTETVDQ